MARELKMTDQNKIIVFDKLTGTRLEIYYSTITSTDRIKYKSEILNVLTKSHDLEESINLQLIWAEKKITGFRKGDFTLDGKQISSNSEDVDYYQGWFAVLKETATDILLSIIDTILGEPSYVVRDNPLPFEKS